MILRDARTLWIPSGPRDPAWRDLGWPSPTLDGRIAPALGLVLDGVPC